MGLLMFAFRRAKQRTEVGGCTDRFGGLPNLKVYPKVNCANVKGGLVRSVDDAGDGNGIHVATNSSRFIEDRLVREIQTDCFGCQQPSSRIPALDETQKAPAVLTEKPQPHRNGILVGVGNGRDK